MKTLLLGLAVGLLAGIAVATWFARRSHDAATPAMAAAAQPGANAAGNPLRIPADQRQASGIAVAKPRETGLPPEADAFGRVLDPTPYVTLVAEETTAKAALNASEKELDRVERLHAAGGNMSAQAVEAAQAAATKDRAAVAAIHARLLAGWGPALANYRDLQSVMDEFARGAALIRIDLTPGTVAAAQFKSARVAPLAGDTSYDVEILGAAPVADAQVQGRSFLAILRNTSLPAGLAVEATVPGTGEPTHALVLPRRAVVYHQGSAWVYVFHEQNFVRRRVTLGRTVGDEVAITSGLSATDSVATAGAQQLLSAELAAGGETDER